MKWLPIALLIYIAIGMICFVYECWLMMTEEVPKRCRHDSVYKMVGWFFAVVRSVLWLPVWIMNTFF